MKRILFCMILCAMNLVSNAQQLLNNGFEDWGQLMFGANTLTEASGWLSENMNIVDGNGNQLCPFVVVPSGDAHTGQYSAKLEVHEYVENSTIYREEGFITSYDPSNLNYISLQNVGSARPDSLVLWYKFLPYDSTSYVNFVFGIQDIDQLDINATFFRYANGVFYDSTTNWTRYSLPLNEPNISSNDGYMVFNIGINGPVGSEFFVDDIELIYNSVNLTQYNLNSFKVYPNPTNHLVTIETMTLDDFKLIDVVNVQGQSVSVPLIHNQNSNNMILDFSNIPVGSYFVKVIYNDEVLRIKVNRI